MDEVFHHAHHAFNRKKRESNPEIPDMPEERNQIFFVYPICMGISFILFIGWLCTKILYRKPIIVSKLIIEIYNFEFKLKKKKYL